MQHVQKQDKIYNLVTVKGLTKMNHSPIKRLTSYIDELVIDKATATQDGYQLSINTLDIDEKSHLAYLFFEYYDRDISDFLVEDYDDQRNDKISCSLINLLKNNSTEGQRDFAAAVRDNVIKMYAHEMQTKIDERCVEVEADIAATQGKYRYQDRSTGEFYWGAL
jgi:hypothetical protein